MRYHYDLPFFIAAILAFRSSRRRAISLSFSSLLILARLGVTADVAWVVVVAGSSSGISSHPDVDAAGVGASAGAIGTEGFEGGLGEVTGVGLAELDTELVVVGFELAAVPDPLV